MRAIAPQAEIDQVVWVDPQALPDLPFAPLTRSRAAAGMPSRPRVSLPS
jgi:hypothetical protein